MKTAKRIYLCSFFPKQFPQLSITLQAPTGAGLVRGWERTDTGSCRISPAQQRHSLPVAQRAALLHISAGLLTKGPRQTYMTAYLGTTGRTYTNTQVTVREGHNFSKHLPSCDVML